MAGIARFVSNNVTIVLTRRDIAVMATFTGTDYLGMVDMTDPLPAEG